MKWSQGTQGELTTHAEQKGGGNGSAELRTAEAASEKGQRGPSVIAKKRGKNSGQFDRGLYLGGCYQGLMPQVWADWGGFL